MPELDIALNWCWNISVEEPPKPKEATKDAPGAQARFSEMLTIINDTLLKHPDAFRAVQAAIRLWRDGPEPWPDEA